MEVIHKKSTSVFTRISPELKNQAEEVLNQLQIPMSTAISMFLQQVVNQQGIPFELKTASKPLKYEALSRKKFDREIQKGFDDFKEGGTISATKIRDEFEG